MRHFENMASKMAKYWLFLIGLGSATQIHFFGSIGISELFLFVVAPFVYLRDFRALRRDGFGPFLTLIILTCFGCVLASYINNTPRVLALKGLATPYALFASTVVIYHFLRRNLDGLKWILIGMFISGIVCVFVFQPETYTVHGDSVATGNDAVEAVTGYALFWSSKITGLMRLPVTCWYFKMPMAYNLMAPLVSVVILLMFSSGSGRAAAMVSLCSFVLLFWGRKSRSRMARLGKQFWLLLIVGLIALAGLKAGYSYAAETGLMGEDAQRKYFKQTQVGSSALHLLMAGRIEFFVCMRAAFDRPIIGYGPKALDEQGYTTEYLRKYGSQEDYERQLNTEISNLRQGFVNLLPAHSLIGGYWVYYGIFGLILWLYVLWLFYQYLRKFAWTIPQWFGYIALSIPTLTWDIFFSPSISRVGFPLLIVCILLARTIGKGSMRMPAEMEMEARLYDK